MPRPAPPDLAYAAALRSARARAVALTGKKLTGKEIADAIGVSEGAYSRYESGERAPGPAEKAALEGFFRKLGIETAITTREAGPMPALAHGVKSDILRAREDADRDFGRLAQTPGGITVEDAMRLVDRIVGLALLALSEPSTASAKAKETGAHGRAKA